jgi:hypothetical protein
MRGLGNVDNTSDANKPISTATQAALNGKLNIDQPTHRKYFAYDNSSAILTGSTSQTVIRNIPIPASSIGANGKFRIESQVTKTGAGGTCEFLYYLSTVGTNTVGNTGVPTSSTQIGRWLAASATNQYALFGRTISNKNSESLNEVILPTNSNANDQSGALVTVFATLNIDTTVDLWLVQTANLAVGTDIAISRNTQLYIDKP